MRRPRPLGPLGFSNSQQEQTLKLVLHDGLASFRIISSHPVQRIAADRLKSAGVHLAHKKPHPPRTLQ